MAVAGGMDSKLTGGEEHHDSDNTCREQGSGVTGQTELAENGRRIVENCVNTGPLLKEHGNRSHDDTLKHGLGLEKRTNSYELEFEGIPRCQLRKMGELFSDTTLLEHGLGLDLKEF